MWFKRKPVKVQLGDRIQIRIGAGGKEHILELDGISVSNNEVSAVFTDNWRRYRV